MLRRQLSRIIKYKHFNINNRILRKTTLQRRFSDHRGNKLVSVNKTLSEPISFFRDKKNDYDKNSKKYKNDDNNEDDNSEHSWKLFFKILGVMSVSMITYKYYIYLRKLFTKKITFQELFRLLETHQITKLEV